MSGDYYLIVLANGQAVTAADPKASSRVLFTLPQDPLNRAQHWRFDSGYIVSKLDQTVFDVYNELNTPHSPVGLYGKKVAPANITNQQFTLTSEGYLQADINKASGLVLSINASSTVEIDTKAGTVGQIFKKVAAPPDVTTAFTNSTAAAATVYFNHNGQTLVLTIPAGGTSTYVSAQGSEFVAKDPSGAILEPTKIVANKDATVTLQPHIVLPSVTFNAYPGDYGVDQYVFSNNNLLGTQDITFFANVKPTAAAYGMIFSKDKSSDAADQFRLEIYDDRHVAWTGLGIENKYYGLRSSHPTDPNGWGSDLLGGPLPLNSVARVALVRRGSVLSLFIDGKKINSLDNGSGVYKSTNPYAFRVGSRYAPGASDAPVNTFQGEITGARLWFVALPDDVVASLE